MIDTTGHNCGHINSLRKRAKIAAILLLVLFTFSGFYSLRSNSKTNADDIYADIEFEIDRIKEPEIPDNVVNILEFGAIEGGSVLNTNAFTKAIEAVTKKGGGKVVIPPGIWLTGPIILKSNLELHAESGAIIKFSTDKDLYPVIETSFEGLNTWRCLSPIYGKNIENVAFTGSGIWDGSGDAWRMVKKSKLTETQWKKLIGSGGYVNDKNEAWYPSEQFYVASKNADQNVRPDLKTKEEFEAIRDFLRPVMLSIQNSKKVMFDGPVFQNSPAWCLHPLMVEDLIVRNITVRNPWYSQNGDGIDIESCKNVLVQNSSFDVGDDAICIKSGKDKDGRLRGIPCENIIIKDNVVYHGHGGVTVGSEMSGGVKNMHVSNCTFIGTDVGIRFKSTRGRGGIVENIFISHIRMIDIQTQAISFNLYYGGLSVSESLSKGNLMNISEPKPITEETPQFKNVFIKNITIDGAYQAAFLQGLPEMNLENIKISNLYAKSRYGISVIDANKVNIENINLTLTESSAIDIVNGKNIILKGIEYNNKNSKSIRIYGDVSENIVLISVKGTDFSKQTFTDEKVPISAVKFE